MRRSLIVVLAAVSLAALTGAPARDRLPVRPEAQASVDSHRVEIELEIIQAPPPEPKDRPDLAAELFRLTNDARGRAGLKPLVPWKDAIHLAAEAQTDRMVAADKLFHNTGLDALLYKLRVQTIAENVGMGPSIPSLHRAFMKSKYHRENILDGSLSLVGIWAVEDVGGIIYVTVVFGRPLPRRPAVKA